MAVSPKKEEFSPKSWGRAAGADIESSEVAAVGWQAAKRSKKKIALITKIFLRVMFMLS
jgi:hypothetical protein